MEGVAIRRGWLTDVGMNANIRITYNYMTCITVQHCAVQKVRIYSTSIPVLRSEVYRLYMRPLVQAKKKVSNA